MPITATRMDALERAYRVLGFEDAGGNEVFIQPVRARIIEPVSDLDSARVLQEACVAVAFYRTITRRLRTYAADSSRRQISAACAANAGLGFAVTDRACREAGWVFQRTGGPDPTFAANVRWLAGYRHSRCYRSDIAKVLLE